jgi:DNA-binding LacI/PurR family transcriptional regulator
MSDSPPPGLPEPDSPVRATIRQVAAAAGVSDATVSRVLNNPNSVSPELAARVQAAVQQLGYRPNRSARDLRVGRSFKRVGFLVSNIQNPFFTDILKGVEQTLIPNQVAVIVGNSNNDVKYEQLNLEIMLEEQVSGLIIQFCSNRPKNYLDLAQSGVPVVCVDHVPAGMLLDSVVANNCEAMAQATRHLLALGHRRFALVGGPLDHDTAIERQRGFVLALAEAGLGAESYAIENGQWLLGGFYAAAQQLLARMQPPFALLTVNNDATTATLKAIRERQWRIPEDVAFVGFDEMPWTDAYNPPLTVVDQHPYHIGAVAAELLFSRMRNPKRPVQQAKLACGLVVRQSCGTPLVQRPGASPI